MAKAKFTFKAHEVEAEKFEGKLPYPTGVYKSRGKFYLKLSATERQDLDVGDMLVESNGQKWVMDAAIFEVKIQK